MEREPARQQHDFDGNVGHAAPWQLPKQRKRNARKDVGSRGAAFLQNRGAGALHVGSVWTVAGKLQGVIRFYGAA